MAGLLQKRAAHRLRDQRRAFSDLDGNSSAPPLCPLFSRGFGGHEYRISEWKKVYDIPDEDLWRERLVLKEKLVRMIRRRYCDPSHVRMDSPHQVMQVLEGSSPTC